MWVTSCNRCVTLSRVLARIVKCVKILQEVGRGLFTSVGLEVFPCKNSVSIISFALFR